MASTLLLEIGCEELPTSFLDGALRQLADLVIDELTRARLSYDTLRTLGTPRRLAVVVEGVPAAVEAREEELLGPAEGAAKTPTGEWSKAAEGFARKNNVSLADLSIAETPKGRYLRAVKRTPGAAASTLLPEVLGAVCRRITFAKSMRWADGEVAFGRPIQWIVALLDDAVVPFAFAGVTAGRSTRGHRFLAPDLFDLPGAGGYVEALAAAHVQVDTDARRAGMMAALHAAAKESGGALREDAFLEREVTGLVEEAFVVAGRFDEDFLKLPDALIESVMRDHQRYFAVLRPGGGGAAGNGRLLPVFLTVVNTALDPDTIRRGNERVMRARLSDAAFFVEQDRKRPLCDRVADLNGVVFHAKLGSYGEKAWRLAKLAPLLCEGFGGNSADVSRAAVLAKADLVTLTVGEFPELQGEMGRYHAQLDGEPTAVADAVGEHYQPKGATDDVAPSPMGAIVAIADRIDTLVGCLAVGLRPTGSEDPFGLRRLAGGIVRTLLHHGVRTSLTTMATWTWDVFHMESGKMLAAATAAGSTREALVATVVEFCAERLRVLLTERYGRDPVAACMAAGKDDPVDVAERVEALATFWKTPAAADLGVAFKRVFNISREAPAGELTADDLGRLTLPAEVGLIEAFARTRMELAPLWAGRRYDDALELIARSLRAPVDRFFTEVFVMDKDEVVRASRLRLLGRIADEVAVFARFDALEG
ncbi:MAG: glycine--tRNA ligase subunit beta [Deltaproteobacteria bacterium]|nr:glycine--tRNA ligase subunit beta [Myxococcales bacterium]MDP3215166.1 glycine--tRNA ligase subunit beta [Deltaproteobacteria bacterium]